MWCKYLYGIENKCFGFAINKDIAWRFKNIRYLQIKTLNLLMHYIYEMEQFVK